MASNKPEKREGVRGRGRLIPVLVVAAVILVPGLWWASNKIYALGEQYQLVNEAARLHLADAPLRKITFDKVSVDCSNDFLCFGPTNPEMEGTYELQQTTLGAEMPMIVQRLRSAGYTVRYSPNALDDVTADGHGFFLNAYVTYHGEIANDNSATPVDGIHISLQNTAVKDY